MQPKNYRKDWKKKDDLFIKKNIDKSLDWLCRKLKRTQTAVQFRINVLNLSKGHPKFSVYTRVCKHCGALYKTEFKQSKSCGCRNTERINKIKKGVK